MRQENSLKRCKKYRKSCLKRCKSYINKYGPSYVLHSADYKEEGHITYLPLYMTPLL